MLLSFIVTSYNYSEYIVDTINSIKNQTINDYEIIVVDDCSSDDSVKILKNISKINLIEHDKNKGQLASIISGVKFASGKYISIIDSDDTIEKNYAETLIREIEANKVVMACSNNKKKEIISIKTNPFGGWWWSPMSCAILKKSAVEDILNYDNAKLWKICPDKFLFNIAYLKGDALLLDKKLVNKRVHNKNAGKSRLRFLINLKNNLLIRHEALKIIEQPDLRQIIIKSYPYFFMQIINKIFNIDK